MYFTKCIIRNFHNEASNIKCIIFKIPRAVDMKE